MVFPVTGELLCPKTFYMAGQIMAAVILGFILRNVYVVSVPVSGMELVKHLEFPRC